MADLGLTTSTTLEALLQSEVGTSGENLSSHIKITMPPPDVRDNSAEDQAGPRAFEPTSSRLDDMQPLTSQEALSRLHDDIYAEILIMKHNFNSRSLLSWLMESISFRSELSKMRWPSVVFMTAQAMAHFVVAFVLHVENLATNWVGFQGFILTALLITNLAVNLWDTKLRFKELMMKAEQIRLLVKRCANDRHLLRRWKHFNWKSANAKNLFIPKSPCVHQTITYRDDSCLNLSDFLLVQGDIIHLFPGERAPSDCVSLNTRSRKQALLYEQSKNDINDGQITLKEGEIFHLFTASESKRLKELAETAKETKSTKDTSTNLDPNADSYLRAHAKLRQARRGMDFLVSSTPYRKSLRISLQQSHMRPVNSIEKECFIVSRKYFETYVIPMVFVLSTVVTAIHYGYLDLTDSDQEIKTISIAFLLLRPSLTIMPFLPWMFPCFWMAVNAYGSARLLCCAETQRRQKSKESKQGANDWFSDQSPGWNGARRHSTRDQYKSPGGVSHFENLLATPNPAGSSDQNRNDDELHDLQSNIEFTKIFRVFLDLVYGKSGHVWRSSSLLQVLGCMTSLCCIDKNGILSWPNPTPEKVFVVAENQDNNHHVPRHHRLVSNVERPSQASMMPHSQLPRSARIGINNRTFDASSSNSTDMLANHTALIARHSLPESYRHEDDQLSADYQFHQPHRHPSSSVPHVQGRAEVLDISLAFSTYRASSGFTSSCQSTRLQFDDPHWTKFLANLKPLGLGILLNNCCDRSFGDYFRFMRHITYESILRCNLSPVVKRRCICSLSRLIGFTRESIKNYRYINQLGVYKLADPSSVNQGKLLVSSLENTNRLKLPFPNMVCNIQQDTITGGYQVFSQGTADLVLDACAEYWNGKQLVPLDEITRKKIIDFYHRTSLTSYCSAFAYSPLLKGHDLHEQYIEMPSEGSKYSPQLRKMTNDLYEEFFRSQVMSVHPPIRPTNRFDTNKSNQGALSSETSNNPANSNVSSSPITSSPNSRTPQTYQPEDSHNYDWHKNQKVRQHLSAEDILIDISRDHASRHRADGEQAANRKSIKRRKLEEALDELTDQVFVGMVAMQYQACPDFVMLIEQLEHACIRFVHFSKENELRSRVFSEKMGLESGWNCHVSLQSDQALDRADKSGATVPRLRIGEHKSEAVEESQQIELKPFYPPTRISDILTGHEGNLNKCCDQESHFEASLVGSNNKRNSSYASDDGTLQSCKSLPLLVMQIITRVSSLANNQNVDKYGQDNLLRVSTGGQLDLQSERDHNIGSTSEEEESSNKDEGFDTLAFDMSNRAKLPKGIENIRPHLETVDNIPLQVSLFTDCTTELTKEMIEIMQDYGEIVCVIGSSSSRFNTPIFLQANASIGIEPLMPKSCTQNEPRGLTGHKNQRKRAAAAEAAASLKRSQAQPDSKSKKKKRSKDSRPTISKDVSQQPPTKLKVNNPRDRLGIGPTIFSEHGEPANQANNKRHSNSREAQTNLTSSISSSSSSSSSSSTSRQLSQSLSESNSSSSSSDDDDSSSSCYSVDGRCGQQKHRKRQHAHHESHDGDDDETIDEEEFAKAESADERSENLSSSLVNELPEPSSLASKLASLPCSYNYNRREQVHLYSLIMEARHFTFKMKNTFVCMICFALSISSAQFLASLLFLPPMLSSGLTIWLTVVVVPLMSFSLMSTTMDSQVMKIAVGKNLQLKPENITFFVICYLIKFIPSIIVVVLSFGFIIAHSCKLTGFGSSSLGPCWMFTYVRHTHNNATGSRDESGEEDLLWSSHLLTAQVSAAFLMVLYFVVISSGFVHRSHLMWQRSPIRNRFWVFISLILIVGQLLYNQLVLQVNLGSSKVPYEFLASLPLHIWLISLVWPILVIGINLAVKRAEIKATIRQQRRARFDFNTKLGMNSPF